MKIIFRDCSREVFESISRHIKYGTKYFSKVTAKYNGSNLYGDIEVEVYDAGDYPGTLELVMNILCGEKEA